MTRAAPGLVAALSLELLAASCASTPTGGRGTTRATETAVVSDIVATDTAVGDTDTTPTDTAPTDTAPTDTAPTDTAPTDTGLTDTGTVVTDPDVVLVEGGQITCAQPAARAASRFRAQRLGEVNTGDRNLSSAGMVIADFDNDGLMEWFAPGNDGFRFLERQPDGTWVDIMGERMPPIDHLGTVGGSAADYDGDGDLDLFITAWERPDILLRNDDGAFVDVTAVAGVAGGEAAPSQSSSWGDYDLDGDLDLVVGVYGGPIGDGHVGHPSYLFRNEGDGTFSDQSALMPPEAHAGYTFLSAWQDIDGDMQPELLVLNDHYWGQPTVLLKFDGQRFLVDEEAGFHPLISSMGLGIGDVNDDLIPDTVESTWRDISLLHSLATSNTPNGVRYVEYSDTEGLSQDSQERHQIFGWGTELMDVDNDADLDVAMLFGFWDMHPETDFTNPEPDSPEQPDALFLKSDDGYADVAGNAEWRFDDVGSGRGLLAVDVNGDGWLDLAKRMLDDHDVIHEAVCGDESWVEVQLRAPAPNTHAVGARIVLEAAGRRQVRWIGAGNTSMYSGGPPIAHFGLARADVIDRLSITWPHDGVTHTFSKVDARQTLSITRRR